MLLSNWPMLLSSLGKPLASFSNRLILDRKFSLGVRSFFLVLSSTTSLSGLSLLVLFVSVEKIALAVATRFRSRALFWSSDSSLFFDSTSENKERKRN